MRALGEAVTQLPWLCPRATSLLALAQPARPTAWVELRDDPAAVLLVLRSGAARPAAPARPPFAALLRDPSILEGVLPRLAAGQLTQGFIDWSQPLLQPIYQAAVTYAQAAHRLAELSGRCDPDTAWTAGLLTPLGWFAIGAVAPELTAACLAAPTFVADPVRTQQQLWGLDQAALARRLLRRWQLPAWLSASVGHLGLSVELAQSFGAEPDLFRTVQLAVLLTQQRHGLLRLSVGAELAATAAALGVTTDQQAAVQQQAVASPPASWPSPANLPLLGDLLSLAAENLRLRDAPRLEQLEHEQDQLHQAVQELRTTQREQLQTQKLAALAEFAAGAGHEINNPLAVISGQAQYLLRQLRPAERGLTKEAEPDPAVRLPAAAFRAALETIIAQTQRIHQLLHGLMQFARPPRPRKQPTDAGALIRQVVAELSETALRRGVRLVCPEPTQPASLDADPEQARTALSCLLQNAIEAAPADGWAGVRLETPAADRVDLVVEDNGGGPSPLQREHLFDPFYCGRQAGRGRGLGLPTAWRLAREHGGDVRYDSLPGGPTRFVLTLPRYNGGNGTVASGPGLADGCSPTALSSGRVLG